MKIKHLIIGLFATLSLQSAIAQDYPTDYLSPEFHAGRRAAFKEKMSDKGVGIFFASQTRQRSNDTEFQYAQNKNFYYLTGLEEPNAVLLLFKQPVTLLGKTGTEFIFVQNRDPFKELWTGKILGVDGFKAKSKMENVFINDQFTSSSISLAGVDSVYTLYRSEGIFTKYQVKPDPLSRMASLVDSLVISNAKPLASRSTLNTLRTLRGIKQPEEIALIQKAASISVLGHNDVMRAVKPGMKEYQAQAIMEYHFK
ncbi:MAG: Xaa-Pro aminopeptidase, partial [Bacteroidota bacterium]